MAESVSTIGYGDTLEWSTDGGSTFNNAVTELKTCDLPATEVEKVERTHMSSPNRTKEYTLGLRDIDNVNFTFNFNSTDYEALFALEAAGTVVTWRHTLATEDGTTSGATYVYKGGVQVGAVSREVVGVAEVPATIIRTGAAAFTAAS